MSQHWFAIADNFPFVALAMGKIERPLATKLMETAIMSVIAGAVGVYVGVEVIKNDLAYLKAGVAETNVRIEKLENKVEQIRADLYVPRGGK